LKRDNFSGHVNYSCPELILEKDYFSKKVDVWSFGCCIYYMLIKKDPFEGKQTNETKKNILNSMFDKVITVSKFCDEKVPNKLMQAILFNSLQFNEFQRPSFFQIIQII
jgi:serine/threonine protein kinase